MDWNSGTESFSETQNCFNTVFLVCGGRGTQGSASFQMWQKLSLLELNTKTRMILVVIPCVEMCNNLNHISCTKAFSFLCRNICLVRQALIQGPHSAVAAYILCLNSWRRNGAALHTRKEFLSSIFMHLSGTLHHHKKLTCFQLQCFCLLAAECLIYI